jgi:hypothetical protein
MTDEELAQLKARIDGGVAGGFYPDDAYAAIDQVVADLIAARERVKQCEAMLLTMRTHIIEILDD